MDFEERLLKLERENRRLKKYIFVLALLVLLPLFASPIWFANAANSSKTFSVDKITTKSLFIVNNEGKIGTILSASVLGGNLNIYNNKGKSVASLFALPDGGFLNLSNNQKKSGAMLSASDGFPFLMLSDKNGFSSTIGSTDLVTPKTGKTHNTSAASITLYDNKKNIIWKAP